MIKIHNPHYFDKLPDAVLFDIDNTLYAYDPAHEVAMNAVCKKAINILSIKTDQFYSAFNQARHDIKIRLGKTASSHSRLLYFQRMLEIMGHQSPIVLALDFEQTYWRLFLNHVELFSGIKELLDDLRLLSIPCTIVTDLTAQIQFQKLVYFELEHYFNHIITSEEAGFDKPHSAPFQIALEKTQPAGNTIWMIGDNSVNDILGAKKAIQAITIQKVHTGVKEGQGEEQADAIIHDFDELSHLLKKIASDNVA